MPNSYRLFNFMSLIEGICKDPLMLLLKVLRVVSFGLLCYIAAMPDTILFRQDAYLKESSMLFLRIVFMTICVMGIVLPKIIRPKG